MQCPVPWIEAQPVAALAVTASASSIEWRDQVFIECYCGSLPPSLPPWGIVGPLPLPPSL